MLTSAGKEEALLLLNNPFFRLEHQVTDQKKASESVPKLSAILETNEKSWKNDYELSRVLRGKFRREKKVLAEERSRTEALRGKLAVDLPLLAEKPEDAVMARNVTREAGRRIESLAEATTRLKSDLIFGGGRKSAATQGGDANKLSFLWDHQDAQQDSTISQILDFKHGSALSNPAQKKLVRRRD